MIEQKWESICADGRTSNVTLSTWRVESLEAIQMENSALAEACRKTRCNTAEQQRRRCEKAVSQGYRRFRKWKIEARRTWISAIVDGLLRPKVNAHAVPESDIASERED